MPPTYRCNNMISFGMLKYEYIPQSSWYPHTKPGNFKLVWGVILWRPYTSLGILATFWLRKFLHSIQRWTFQKRKLDETGTEGSHNIFGVKNICWKKPWKSLGFFYLECMDQYLSSVGKHPSSQTDFGGGHHRCRVWRTPDHLKGPQVNHIHTPISSNKCWG